MTPSTFEARLFGGPRDGAVLKETMTNGKYPHKIDVGKRTDYIHGSINCLCWQYYYFVRNVTVNSAIYIWEGMGNTDAIIL